MTSECLLGIFGTYYIFDSPGPRFEPRTSLPAVSALPSELFWFMGKMPTVRILKQQNSGKTGNIPGYQKGTNMDIAKVSIHFCIFMLFMFVKPWSRFITAKCVLGAKNRKGIPFLTAISWVLCWEQKLNKTGNKILNYIIASIRRW